MTLPEAIIFDHGSVLEGPLDKEAFEADLAALAAEHDFEAGRDLWLHIYISEAWEQAKRGKIPPDAFWQDRLSALGLESAPEQAVFRKRLFRSRGIYPEMRTLLSELHPRCRLAILSNTAHPDLGTRLAKDDKFGNTFELTISSADVGLAKPEPEIYLLTLERLNLSAEQVLFIDDLERNTKAAEALGIASIVFTTPDTLRSELQYRGIL